MQLWRMVVAVPLLLVAACPGEGEGLPDAARDLAPPVPDLMRDLSLGDAPAPDTVGGADTVGGTDAAPLPDMLQSSCGPASCTGCCTAAGLCVGGNSDIQCGSGGAPCVDCAFNGTPCQGGTCAGCTPDCSGVLCGTSDGCGGICTPGSGCCEPDCTGVYCGEGDGCGGECKTGSGCTEPDCVYKVDSDTVALYTFSGSGNTVTDLTGMHPGTVVGTGATRVSGKSGCGNAMRFSPTTPVSHVMVPDSTAFDLKQGSVDLWVRFDSAASTNEGILSRDASGTTKSGHLTILRRCNGAISIRLQNTTNEGNVCSKPLSVGAWHHVGVSFGGSQGIKLYVDGTLTNETADIICGTDTITCGTSVTTGIDGNDNPWVIGASSWNSQEDVSTPVTQPLDGRVDSVRISKVRRSF